MTTTRYQSTDITLPGYSCTAQDLDSSGAVVCFARDGKNHTIAFVWKAGKVLHLLRDEHVRHTPHAMNDHGVVVGSATVDERDYACCWINGERRFLDSPDDRCYGLAMGINRYGVIVGLHEICPDDVRMCATLWFDGRCCDISPDFVPHEFRDIPYTVCVNDHGAIASHVDRYGYIKEGDEFLKICASDESGAEPNVYGVLPHALNNHGVVVGHVCAPDEEYAFRGCRAESLGTLAGSWSQAYDINDAGTIVGSSSFRLGSTESHGFVYQDGKMHDLNDLTDDLRATVIEDANGINNRGQIAATASLDGKMRAILLTPKS